MTTGRRGLRSRRSKPTRSRIAELTRRSSQKKDWEEGRCERKLPSTLSLPKSASAGGLGMGFPWARYYDLAHGNPISHTHIERDFGGGSEGRSPSVRRLRLELRNEVGDDLQRESARLESLRQGTRAAERDVEELRPIAAEVRRYEGAGRAERGTILDSIAARCAGAARAARAAIEELGDRIWALMRPRKAKTEQRSLDDVMREATEAARASEALSRGRVAPTNSRPRGQAR